jgi:YYY domain-containing protein
MNNLTQDNSPVPNESRPRRERIAEGSRARTALVRRLLPLVPDFFLILLILVGVILRFSWTNWSEGMDIHPDEYGLTGTLTQLSIPKSIEEYFNTRISPLSPYQKYDAAGNPIPNESGPDNSMRWGQWPQIIIRAAAETVTGVEKVVVPGIDSLQSKLCPQGESAAETPPACAPIQAIDYTSYGWIRLLGRTLSALADTISLLTLLAIGLRLFSRRIALLGTALSALAVMQIQQSHFMTVDNFAVMFSVLGVYCAIRAARKGGWGWYALFGAFYGMTLASRINMVLLGPIIALAVWMAHRERWARSDLPLVRRFGPAFGQMALAVVMTLLVFRVTQPMSFRAPTGDTTFFTVHLNDDWVRSMKVALQESAGLCCGPPTEQWTNRPAIVFPFVNIVLWGMGLPLGLVSFAALFWAGYRIYKGRDWQAHLLPVVYTAVIFLFLATRWVKSVRYFLAVYPFFCLLAAWALVEIWNLAKPRGGWRRVLAGGLIGLVVLSTLAWAWGFTNIYRHDNTRFQASRWIYQNIPAPFDLNLRLPSGQTYNEPIPFDGNLPIDTDPVAVQVTPRESGTLQSISLGFALDLSQAADSVMHVAVYTEPRGDSPLAETDLVIPPAGTDPRGVSVSGSIGPAALQQNGHYRLEVSAARGGPFTVQGSTIANESWDEGMPERIDGRDGFGGLYTGLAMEVRWPDLENKREMFIDTLAQADYVILPSQRAIWSASRLPAAYPMTIEYYRALFDGRLGFDLVAQFQTPIVIGPLEFSDLAGSVAWGHAPALPLFNNNPLSAEEAFSVYDHAPVWIFKKRADFRIEQVEAILNAIELSAVVQQDAHKATSLPTALLLPADPLKVQQAGGTWSDMFSYEWLWNKYPGIAAFLWWFWAVLTGWAALPLVGKIFRGLPDEGYSIAKIGGWLLVAWATWMLGSLKVPFVWTTIALVWLALVVVGGILLWRDRAHWKESFRKLWKTWLAAEIVFTVFFLFDLLIRYGNSDLWHPSKGGEKPMDFSYLNAVIKSTTFPPYDPWFAGGYLNYYYFGFVLVAVPIKLLATVPTIAYNIALPLLFGTLGVTTYGVAWNLAESLRRKGAVRVVPWVAGLGAAVMLVVLGNFGEVVLVWDGLVKMSVLHYPQGLFFHLGDIPHLLDGALRYVLGQANWPFGIDQWYWNASRGIPVPINSVGEPLEAGPITEFPFFTFLYADLHAHLMAMPLMILALAGSAAMVIAPERLRSWKTALPLVGFTALAVGSLWATNSWNYPISLGIALIALALAGWRMLVQSTGLKDWRGWIWVAILGGILVGLSVCLFQPYYQWYGAGYNAVDPWKGSRTPLDSYFMIHGLFLFILITYLVWQTREWLISVSLGEVKKYSGLGPIVLASVSLLLAGLVILGALGYPVLVLAIPLTLWAILLGLRKSLADEHRVVLGLTAVSLAVTCVVELVVLRGDLSRMNTVFKFYIQAWNLFAVAAGVALGWLAGELWKWRGIFRRLWIGTLAVLVAGCLLYTVEGSYYKIVDRMSTTAPRTLDGITYMYYSSYWDKADMTLREDYLAIRWMQENVKGSPVIVEANTVEYQWGNRFTIYTGLPGVVGWNWHQRQQRGVVTDQWVWDRVKAITEFYQTLDMNATRAFLRKYNVRYIVVGQLEHAYYWQLGLDKFDTMVRSGELKVVYASGQTVIYEVVDLKT